MERHSRKVSDSIVAAAATIFAALISAAGLMFSAANTGAIRASLFEARDPAVSEQLASLERTQASLRDLNDFLERQKSEMRRSGQELVRIRAERAKLQPLLAADRRAIEVLFVAQEARNRAAQAQERWMGFWIGIASSLLATFVWYGVTKLLSRRQDAYEDEEAF
jgi:septal ring factor EnvC (AmiA/AmiB activator)